MSTLVAVAFENKQTASDALHKLQKLEKDYLIDLDDAVVAIRQEDGKVKLKQTVSLVGAGAWHGAWWGALVGLLFGGPLGMVIVGGTGAALGAVTGSLADYGINDEFMKELSRQTQTGSSILFVLIRRATEDKVLKELEGTGGKVIKTSLSEEEERKLQTALDKNKQIIVS